MIKELHENNVRAICVFDGKERHVAKQREASDLVYVIHRYPNFFPNLGYEETRAKENDMHSRCDGDETIVTTYPTHTPRHVV